MQEVFRFVFLRSAKPPRQGGLVAVPADLTSLGHQLRALRQGDDPRTRMREAVAVFARTPEFAADPFTLPLAAELLRLRTAIAARDVWSLRDLTGTIRTILGGSPESVVTSNDYRALQRALVDGNLVLKLRPDIAPRAVGDYARLMVLWALVGRVASRDDTLEGATSARLLDAVLTYPANLLPWPRVADEPPEKPSTSGPIDRRSVTRRVRIGGTTLPAPAPPTASDDIAQRPTSPVPTTVGLLRPAYVGDLEVVRQQIKRYEAGELAHIENILQTEKRLRETRRLERTEQTFTVERESTREQERSLQTTDRFEMEREVKNTLKEMDSFKFGTKVSGGFGKFVQAEVSVGTESSESEETASRTSAKFASEVVSQTAAKLTERVREQQTLTILREFEEKNSHGFDNTAGTGHVVGMYQWVDKVYEVQVYNYGIRLFFDVMVPEPAAFYMQVLAHHAPEGLAEPEPFTIGPDDITETNYVDYVARYHATAVEPPPPPTTSVSKTLKLVIKEPSSANMRILEDGAIQVPAGYEATRLDYQLTWTDMHIQGITPEPEGEMVLQFGRSMLTLDATIQDISNVNIEGFFGDTNLGGETGEVPYSLQFAAMDNIGMTMIVACDRSAAGYAAWKQRAYDAILQAYLREQENYRNQLAELEAQQGVTIVGTDPLTNRALERNEIKRSAISMLTGQYFEKFSAILSSGIQEARVDFDEALAEGSYARFFEQAFEWEFMEAEYLPYYWGRRSTWVEKLRIQGVDATHVAFLQAGFARVRLPVRPDFERGIFHFLDTGEVWEGGELPPVTNRDYAAFLLEIADRRRQPPGEETPVGEPFDVRLPTTLVRVRPTPSLPTWARNEDGEWLPVED